MSFKVFKDCYVCGSFNHLIKDCDFYEKEMVEKPIWNNASRVNHQNSQRLTHPHPKGNFVLKAVLMKYGHKTLNTARQNSSKAAVSVNTARPINTAYPRPTMNCSRPSSNVFNRAHSHVRRPFNKFTTYKNNNFNEKVNTFKGNVTTIRPKAVVSDNKGHEANAIKASACLVWRPKQKVLDHGNLQLELQEKGVIDSGCSRHMTGNKSYLSNYEEIDVGFIAFGGSTKGGKITGKGKIRTGRKPALSFIRLFGCPITILNNIDHLGKFDGKADEGFFVGYSTNSKAFSGIQQLNMDSEENLHVSLVVASNQSNGSVDPSFSSNLKDSFDAGFKLSGEDEKKDAKDPKNEDKNNAVDENIVYGCDDDPNMTNSEEIVYSDDDERVDAKANMTNLDSHILVSPTPTTIIHKDHPLEKNH
ncbi:ribonuclease H-like domain-containing protein [Tanacetum coccineum]